MKRLLTCSVFFCGLLIAGVSPGADLPEFHTFTNKEGQDIEAKVESVSLVTGKVTITRRDGQQFELAGNLFDLDDQAFLKQWYAKRYGPSQGRLRCFGVLPKDGKIDASLTNGLSDFMEVHAMKDGWLAVRANGAYLEFSGRRRDISNVKIFEANTVWFLATKKDGTVWKDSSNQIHEGVLSGVTKAATGRSHSIAILSDGSVKVWGSRNGGDKVYDPPMKLEGIVDVATSQGDVAAVDEEGKVYRWKAGGKEVKSTKPGDGAVAVEGSIFDFLALTKSGEVYQWGLNGLDTIQIPKKLIGEGPFLKIRCNGSTRAAQKMDGSWIAWGKNASGIVDHINSLGPVIDIAFFSEPGAAEHGYVVWIEKLD